MENIGVGSTGFLTTDRVDDRSWGHTAHFADTTTEFPVFAFDIEHPKQEIEDTVRLSLCM